MYTRASVTIATQKKVVFEFVARAQRHGVGLHVFDMGASEQVEFEIIIILLLFYTNLGHIFVVAVPASVRYVTDPEGQCRGDA